MKLNDKSIVYIPDGIEQSKALSRTTHLCIAAHQDDIEFMAFGPIAECFGSKDKYFCGVVTTDGAGSPRNGLYENYSDEDMKAIRITEQKKAATVGEYTAQILLGYSSAQVKDKNNDQVVTDYIEILKATKPEYVYIHNLADKHETHVGELKEVGVFGNDYDTPDGTGVRDYIHVVDLAKGHVAAIDKTVKSGVYTYNLGTGIGYSVLDVIHAFEKACGKEPPYSIKPRRPGDIAACYADASKAKRELGWEAKLGIDEMCASLWNWQQKNPKGYKD